MIYYAIAVENSIRRALCEHFFSVSINSRRKSLVKLSVLWVCCRCGWKISQFIFSLVCCRLKLIATDNVVSFASLVMLNALDDKLCASALVHGSGRLTSATDTILIRAHIPVPSRRRHEFNIFASQLFCVLNN